MTYLDIEPFAEQRVGETDDNRRNRDTIIAIRCKLHNKKMRRDLIILNSKRINSL